MSNYFNIIISEFIILILFDINHVEGLESVNEDGVMVDGVYSHIRV